MKYLLVLIMTLFAQGLMAQLIQPLTLTQMKDSENFFPISNQTLILDFSNEASTLKFSSVLKNAGEEIIKLKTEELSGFKLTTGMNLKYLNFSTGEIGNFKIGTEVYIRRIIDELRDESVTDKNYYSGFQIILSDDLGKIKNEHQKNKLTNGSINGIAYTGNVVKLKPDKMVSILKPLSLPNTALSPVIEEIKKYNPGFDLSEAYETNIGSNKFYRLVGSKKFPNGWMQGGSTLLLKKGDKFLSFKDFQDKDYSIFNGEFKAGTIFEGADAVLFIDGDKMHDCSRLIVISKDKIEELTLRCDSGGC